MTMKITTLVVAGALILFPFRARTDDDDELYGEPDTVAVEATAPSAPAPSEVPPAPPTAQPPAPAAQAAPAAASAELPPGQWVYTWQYGWVWMPYADTYSWVPSDGWGEPLLYVYYPVYGWCWIDAPWVWGIGPWPYFGGFGVARFGWYAHGWWREPWRWHYAPPRAGSTVGFRPAPGRPLGGTVVRPAPLRSRDFGGRGIGPMVRPGTPRYEAGGLARGAPERGGEVRGGFGGGFRGGGGSVRGGFGRGGAGRFR